MSARAIYATRGMGRYIITAIVFVQVPFHIGDVSGTCMHLMLVFCNHNKMYAMTHGCPFCISLVFYHTICYYFIEKARLIQKKILISLSTELKSNLKRFILNTYQLEVK